MEHIDVYFRRFPEGDVIALWDDGCHEPWISSYQHVGQHSEASKALITDLEPVTAEEYAPLLDELKSIGYAVTVIE